MARARNIKPGFFKNEELGALPMGARLLFVGMWTLADREGRLEDRPARIAAEVFPYDREICVSTVSTWIDALAGFVTRYTADGGKYIAINNFAKHQTPHIKEQASTIPAPDKHQTCTVQAPDLPLPTQLLAPPDSLNPSSLNPDSLIPEKTILPGTDAPADVLAEMGWIGVAKTSEEVCSQIAALSLMDFPESKSLKSAYMIICRLCWFEDFWAFYWRKDDKRKARVKYFEKVTSAKLQLEVENAVIAQAPEMLAREKQHRKLAATWLHGECWLNQPTLLDGAE